MQSWWQSVTGSATKLHPIYSKGEESAGCSLPPPHRRVLGFPQKSYVQWWKGSKVLWQTAGKNQAEGLQNSCQNHQKTISNHQRSNADDRRFIVSTSSSNLSISLSNLIQSWKFFFRLSHKLNELLGSGPDRGRCPVEHRGEIPSVHTFVHT